MNLLALAASAVVLIPVAHNDPVLQEDTTFVSEAAAALMAQDANGEGLIHCLEIPERAASHTRACLTIGEWHAVFAETEAEVARRESVIYRQRAEFNGLRNASPF